MVAALVTITWTGGSRIEAEEIKWGTRRIEFLQITDMRLDAGVQTFESFRVFENGIVEWARWNSSGFLLDHAKPCNMGSDIFDRIRSSPGYSSPPDPSSKNVVGRPAYRVEMTIMSGSGVESVSMSEMPVDIADITHEIRRNLEPAPVKPGWYVWTQPSLEIDNPDIVIKGTSCDSGIAETLSKAIAAGRLVVPAENDNVEAFVSGELANRNVFTAGFPDGILLFGILSAK